MDIPHDATVEPGITPPRYPLLPGEQLFSVTDHQPRTYPDKPSSVEQLLRLTRSSHTGEIGRAGPALASLAMDTHSPTHAEHPDDAEHLHLYEALFGRDSLRVASFLVATYPELAHHTILALAELQGVTYDASREEEPGRIVHEARTADDPIAQKLTAELGWQWPYYGAVDTAAEFIRTLSSYVALDKSDDSFLDAEYVDRSGATQTISTALERALGWIEHKRAQTSEGFIEFKSVLPQGIENQVWKDSWDAYHHADGTLANHKQGIASLEVQVAAYDALLDAVELYETSSDNPTHATALRVQAGELGEAILEHFWTEDKGGYFVLGLDRDDNGDYRQLHLRTSNMGHVLNSRLLESEDPSVIAKREAVVAHLLSPELLCTAGIRTLASDEVRFRAGAYHNGSVWIWDTHYIAEGLRRHGLTGVADTIDNRLIDITNVTGLFPEYVRGEQHDITLNRQTVVLWDEAAQRKNIIEQPPQEVQAWTVAAILASKLHFSKR